MTLYGKEYLFAQVGSAVPAASPPSLLPIPGLLAAGQSEEQRRPWPCAITAQQQLKDWCVINTALVTNLKHSTIRAAMKKINSIPARLSTVALQ